MNERKIRVLHVGIDSHLGGIETYLLKIATYIDKEKYQFNFLAFKGSEPCFRKELEELGCHFFYIEQRRKNYINYITDLKRLYENKQFDIVHCHMNSLSCIEPIILALKYGCKVLVHSHNSANIVSVKSRILHKIGSYFLPMHKVTRVAVSDLAGKWMFKNNDFQVLNNGLDVEKFKYNSRSRKEIREELKINKEEEVILHIGAFRTQKNHSFLIDIFNEYVKTNTNATLFLVGEGVLKDKIKAEVIDRGLEKKVVFLGQRDDIAELLSGSDKFLFPSLYEGFPNALIEAQATGLYCVVADTITKQAVFDQICCQVSLKAPLNEWIEALQKPAIEKREKCVDFIRKAGLSIEDEIDRLSKVYNQIID